ncbi:MAG: Inosose isomerase [Lentisphaerae bacterium ADurb.Bin242]|nr:MAG: Inosose isomerase [Lentisphaerae bacterium ADurb.Bin242]
MNCIIRQCNVGCNIVVPEADDIQMYTREVYLRAIPMYRDYGFRNLEFSHLMRLSPEDGLAIRERCRECGISPWSVHSEHLNEGTGVNDYLAVQRHCAEVADALDARIMVCHLPNLSPRFDFERAKNILTRLADITGEFRLKLAVENCLRGDAGFIIRLVDAIGRPDVGINCDTGHAFLYETQDVAGLIRRFGKRLFTTHLQDNFGENDDHQMPGLGYIDWFAVVRAIRETGYAGPLMMEMTGGAVKSRRTVPQLRKMDIDRELVCARAYLEHVWEKTIVEKKEEICAPVL